MAKRLDPTKTIIKDLKNWRSDKELNSLMRNPANTLESGIDLVNTAWKGLISTFGFQPSMLNSNYRQVDALLQKTYSLAEQIARDFEERKAQYTPTTGSEFSLQSVINKVYNNYANESREILKLAEDINNDARRVKDYNNNPFTPKSVTDKVSKFIRNDAQNLQNQASHLASAAQDVGKQVNQEIYKHRNKAQLAVQAARNKKGNNV